VAATDAQLKRASPRDPGKINRNVLAAALALPGVLPSAHAQVTVPNATLVQFKYLYYKDYQNSTNGSGDRMTVNAPALYLLTPISDEWVFEIGAVYDSISGASPYYHTVLSGASGRGIKDGRTNVDATVTKYFGGRTAVSLRYAYSTEDDYESSAYAVTVRHATPDQNTTFMAGVGRSNDKVFPEDGPQFTADKRTTDFVAGITQVFTPDDVGQFTLYYAQQRGYLTDPYKAFWGVDNRPSSRDQWAALFRWNRYVAVYDGAFRASYRYYGDDWKVKAHTVNVEWAQTLPDGWTLTPSFRYATQSAAEFYYDPIYDPVLGAPFPPGYLQNPNAFYTSDQRLAAWGAIAPGLKVSKALTGGWLLDAKAEYYEQRAEWRIGGEGSPGLENFKAQVYQLGVQRKF
jgi:hypothetical protein